MKKINTIKDLENLCFISTKKKINANQDLFLLLDSLELMSFFSLCEKKYKMKINMVKVLNRKKINLKYLLTQLK